MPSAPQLRHPATAAPNRRLAWILALAYLLIIVYATGQPFRGWRMPPREVFHFLTAPWPRYVTLEDVLFNIAGYVPAGFLLALALRLHWRTHAAVFGAILACVLLSVAMEAMQMFLPGRIASNADVLTNSLGAVIGALAAPLFAPTRTLGQRLANLREAWFLPGTATDAGLVIVFLWLLTFLHPTAQLFGTGDLRATFDLPAWFFHTPRASVIAEAAVVCFNLIGLGLLLTTIMRVPSHAAIPLVIVASVGVLLKVAVSITLKTTTPSYGLTHGVWLGLVIGAAVFFMAARLQMRARRIASLLSFIAAIIAINIAPGNPYQVIPPRLLAGASHFLSFSGFARLLSELWPFAAAFYLLAAALRKEEPSGALETGHNA